MCHEIERILARALLARPRPAPVSQMPTASRRVSLECMADEHALCPGWASSIWPEGAAYASKPAVVVDCGCPTPECDCVEARRKREAEG